ncbi:putative late blight resistance protein homolog R1B-23 [Andrographis paniculata]|uniref:putative late blight resistance protein homolog R1B-23 n=1 Tax=Andrographis paniculata TaxID=175694 RepID=UPI0021E75ABB|nr:putative late blight resistance protein homolog R1B-23 [Andrographis paniculata]
MAYYAALTSLMELLDDIIHGGRYPNFLLGRQEIMKSLRKKFSLLLDSLKDYSSKGDEAADRVEGRIRDAAYQAQDVIEFGISNEVDSCFLQQTVEDLAESLREVEEEVDSTLEELAMAMAMEEGTQRSQDLPLQRPYSGAGDILVGIDEDLLNIKEQLCGHSSRLQVIAIVGMGGIGKTTLARAAFDDPLIVEYFDCRAWVTISQVYSMEQICRSILESFGANKNNNILAVSKAHLMELLHKHLFGRRYLIVMDDIWARDAWNDMKRVFPDNSNGSRIVLTTRLLDLAYYVSSGFIQQKSFLDEDNSWHLLQNKVFGQEACSPELEDIGKLITKTCGGLPLAIVAAATILSTNRTRYHWKAVAENLNSKLSRDNDMIFHVLFRESYNNLPHHLKACFLYMASFPEDCEIDVSKLIKLWIAEGLVRSVDGSKSLKQVAEECLVDLVQRSLVMVSKKRANGEFKSCILHDLYRDFCIRRASEEHFFHMDRDWVENARHINIHGTFRYHVRPYNIGNLIRSILLFGKTFGSNFSAIEPSSLKQLRVLGERVTTTWPIPEEIFQMLHLKYLDLYLEGLKPGACLPASISALKNLQTLIIFTPYAYSVAVPPEIWKMTWLNHLIISAMTLPSVPLVDAQKLEHLETLMTVKNFLFTKEAIEVIPNLRKLKISCRGDKESDIWEMHCLNNLVHLHRLEELKIRILSTLYSNVDWMFSRFVFPLNLRKLSLQGCKFSWEEMTVVGWLPELLVLRLREDSVVGEEWEPRKGEFRRLKFLLIERLDLKCWRAQHTNFPCLEHLKIKECFNLEEIPAGIGDVPTLESIKLYGSELARNSAILIQENQQRYKTGLLQVHIFD